MARKIKTTEGGKRTRTYNTFRGMHYRCKYEYTNSYSNYGGKGIVVCDRWSGKSGFSNFTSDMGDRPDGMTLDRIDVNGNYEPGNCQWATPKQQAANKRKKVKAGV